MEPAPNHPPKIRGAFSIVARAALGIAIGGGMGAITWWALGGRIWHGFVIGSALGVFVWLPVGIFLWATFPYKQSDSTSEPPAELPSQRSA